MRKQGYILLCMLIGTAFFIVLLTGALVKTTQTETIPKDILSSAKYREQCLDEDMLSFLEDKKNPGYYVSLYLLENEVGHYSEENFNRLEKKWKEEKFCKTYLNTTKAIWDDAKYFPVPEFTNHKTWTVSYVNTWMSERNYGGQRGHEGTDLMASKNKRGLFPVISMTDGVVTKKGWLEKGGYRIGITSTHGVYFYYAHLDSYANLEEGDVVKAGDILGFMGDSGYGEEGTVGQFAVHLHVGIYIYPDGEEVSVNPYWVLRNLEKHKVKCYTEE